MRRRPDARRATEQGKGLRVEQYMHKPANLTKQFRPSMVPTRSVAVQRCRR